MDRFNSPRAIDSKGRDSAVCIRPGPLAGMAGGWWAFERVARRRLGGDSDRATTNVGSDISNPTALPVHEVAAGKSAMNEPKSVVCRIETETATVEAGKDFAGLGD